MSKNKNTVQCVDYTGAKGEYYLLDKTVWRELRKSQGDEKGKEYTASDSGVLSIRLPTNTKPGTKVRVYLEISEEE